MRGVIDPMYEPNPDFERLRRTLFCEEPDRVPTAELYVDRPAKEGFLGEPVDTLPQSIEFYRAAGYDYYGLRFSYEEDDIATLKAFSSLLLLPLLYLVVAIAIGMLAGFWWGVLLLVVLPFSFLISVRLIEAEIGLLLSMVSVLRLARLGREVEDLRETRAELVQRIRDRVERSVDPGMDRIFTSEDFNTP